MQASSLWFQKHYGDSQSFTLEDSGTLQECFKRLFTYALSSPESRFWYEIGAIDKAYQFYVKLSSYLTILTGYEEKTLREWGLFLQELQEEYCDESPLLENLLRNLGQSTETYVLSFASLYPRLSQQLRGELESYSEQNRLDAISACSLLPMRSVPARIICLLGLGLDQFPRKEMPLALDKRKGRSDCDYAPTKASFDRLLFLETVLSAREHLLISYAAVGDSYEESFVLAELRDYLGLSVIKEAARHLLLTEEKKSFFIQKVAKKEEITLSHLSQALRNPLKLFYQKQLGIYLPDETFPSKSFTSPYPKYLMQQRSLRIPEELFLQELLQKGYLPGGPLKALVKAQVARHYQIVNEAFTHFSLQHSDVKTVHFTKGLEKPFVEGNHLFFPALEAAPGHYFAGKISSCSHKGLLTFKEKSLETLIGEWPLLMAYQEAFPESASLLLLAEKEHFTKKAANRWDALIEYYAYCLKEPRPLFPRVIKSLLKGEEPLIESQDPYFKLFCAQGEEWHLAEALPLLKAFLGEELLCL